MVFKVNVNYLLMILLFSVIIDLNTSATDLNEDLEKLGNWVFKWKKNFNPDPNK